MNKIISLAGTKGGILKSTLTQCISTSKIFSEYKIAIIEGDSQESLLDWNKERNDIINNKQNKLNLPKINIIQHNKNIDLKEEILEHKKYYDFLFIDLPGESEALTLTRSAMAYSDLCIFPLRLSHKDINAFDSNIRPTLNEILKIRDKKHFKILVTFAHHSTNPKIYLENFNNINVIDKFQNVHRDRNIFTYFSINGLTLREYQEQNSNNTESEKAKKAINDIELIAQEALKYVL